MILIIQMALMIPVMTVRQIILTILMTAVLMIRLRIRMNPSRNLNQNLFRMIRQLSNYSFCVSGINCLTGITCNPEKQYQLRVITV